MAKGIYDGVGSVARKVTQPYKGVNAVARKVTSGYFGVSGVARQFYESTPPLEDCTWAEISEIAASGKAPNYWAVGDTKSIEVTGQIGEGTGSPTLNDDYLVYIIGFNHDGATNTIDFGCFKTTDGTDIALCSVSYAAVSKKAEGFTMNYGDGEDYATTTYGGWKGCDLRYGLLGSTDVKPSAYCTSGKRSASAVGYDATSTCATSPKAGLNSVMKALPSDLRAVMKPMTIYTENVGGKNSLTMTEDSITTSIDYLPLLSEFEMFGTTTYSNPYEANYQSQYEYYANGNSKIKNVVYQHSSGTTAFGYWLRSPSGATLSSGAATSFCNVSATGSQDTTVSRYLLSVAPIFRV